MKALSIRQPWAWLIVRPDLSGPARVAAAEKGQIKTHENRDWGTGVRGRVVVHAAKGMTRGEYEDAMHFAVHKVGIPADQIPQFESLQRGGIVGTVEITGCTEDSPSIWFFGRYGFELAASRPCEFVPYKGQLGFFEVPDSLIREAA